MVESAAAGTLYQLTPVVLVLVPLIGVPLVNCWAVLRVSLVTSTAPISQAAPCGRVIPRWSVAGQEAPPPSIAGLPAWGRRDIVGPPLSCSGPRLALIGA